MSTARRCSSLVGRAELVMPMWQRLEHAWGPGARRAGAPAADGAGDTARSARSTPRCARCASTNSTPIWWPPSTCSSARSASIPRLGDGGRGYRRRVAGLITAGRAWARFEHGQVVFKAEVGSQSPAVGQIQGVWVHPDWRGQRTRRRGHRDAGRRPSSAAAAPRACTSTATTPSRGRPTRASASPRSARSPPSCSTDHPPQTQIRSVKSRFDLGAPPADAAVASNISLNGNTNLIRITRSLAS